MVRLQPEEVINITKEAIEKSLNSTMVRLQPESESNSKEQVF